MRVVIYDAEHAGDNAGVAVDPRCPKCKRFCSYRNTSVLYDGWMERAHHFIGWRCPRCGPFEPDVLGWAGDFRDDVASGASR